MNSKDEILKRLGAICFHDVQVDRFSLTTGNTTDLIIGIALFNEDTRDYESVTLTFRDVRLLESDALLMNSDFEPEIYSFDYRWNDLFEGEFVFLTGTGKPSFRVKFQCMEMELT
jgi:hypothetical protein